MDELLNKLRINFEGDVDVSPETLEEYSKDTSLFQVKPKAVVFPKNTDDVEALVRLVCDAKRSGLQISLTGRSAGTDMTGGPLTESIVVVFTRYFKDFEVREANLEAMVESGVYYRDFEKETLPEHISLPCYPASKRLAALGGMVMNNSAGERTLRYGQMRHFVKEVEMTLSDGNTYSFKPLSAGELEQKKSQSDFEGEIYRKVSELISENHHLIQSARPHVSKNSAGYALWDITKEDDSFDLSQLFVGSQGSLGLLNRATVRLIHDKPKRKLISIFFSSWNDLPKAVNEILPLDPEELEVFDDATLKLGLRFMPEIAKRSGSSFIPFAKRFWPEAKIGLHMLGLPKLIVLAEFAEDSDEAIEAKVQQASRILNEQKILYRILPTDEEAEKYWVMRRESFNLLREHVKGKRTVPFVEDFCVPVDSLPEFLPKAVRLLEKNGIEVNVAGHAGNGNLHIIPLMDMTKKKNKDKIVPVAKEFYELVVKYGGTITAEHNDGILRTPFLETMYGKDVVDLFQKVKNIFDPDNIFNPGKKVGGTLEYLESHISAS